jgi:hypothetical protein
VPEKNPDDIGKTSKPEIGRDASQRFMITLGGESLIDAEGDQGDVDQAPDREHIACWCEENLKTVGDFPGILPVDR